MPRIVGQRAVDNNTGRSSKILPMLKDLNEMQANIMLETAMSVDEVNSTRVYTNSISDNALKEWFMNESVDPGMYDAEEYQIQLENMGEIYENNKHESFNEATGIGTINPTVGFNLMMHKNLLVNCVYKQGIPNSVAVSPKFTETFQRFYLVDPKGKRLDIALDQEKLSEAVLGAVPTAEVELKLPELGQTKFIEKLKGTKVDKLAIDTHISKIKFEIADEYKTAHPELVSENNYDAMEEGKTIFKDPSDNKYYTWKEVRFTFTPAAYNSNNNADVKFKFDRALTAKVELEGLAKPVNGIDYDILNANFNSSGDQTMYITSATGLIKGIMLNTKIDASLGTTETPSIDYGTEDRLFEIPAGNPINTTITPDIIKDVQNQYKMNHTSIIIEQTMKVLENVKDDSIRNYLDDSFKCLNPEYKVTGVFDFKPRTDYAFDVQEYRSKSFMDLFESYATKLVNIFNDPDVSFSVFGRTDIIRRLTPTEVTYQSQASMGPITLDFNKTMHTSANRTYNFISSRKIKDDELIITLKPNSGNNRKFYNLYEYCFYLGSEIKNVAHVNVPALHAYERFLVSDFQPVQGRVSILNPTGYENEAYKGL